MSQTMKDSSTPRTDSNQVQKVLAWGLTTLLKDWPLKLLSLTIALALWTGLITQDPTLTRERSFRRVPVSISNAEQLKRNGFIVVSNLSELLQDIDVTVDVPQMQYGEATAANYNVRVDLNRLEKRAGEQELQILTTSTSAYGSVTRISPPSVTVMVEEYVSRSYIPVNVVQQGEAPEGFFVGGISRDPSWITVSGPRSLVEAVDRAEVVLDMSRLPAREGQVERALDFVLLDAEGNAVCSDMLEVTRDSVLRDHVNVSATLYVRKDVDILAQKLYSGKPAEGYEVTDVYVTPSYVTIAGVGSVVNSVDLLQTNSRVSIAGAKETVTGTITLAKPLNLAWMSATEATVTVVIQPRKDTVRTLDVPVTLTGVPTGWEAEISRETAVVRITGEAGWVNALTAEQLRLICDVSGLKAGVHNVPLQCSVEGAQGVAYLAESEPQEVLVTLTAHAAEE